MNPVNRIKSKSRSKPETPDQISAESSPTRLPGPLQTPIPPDKSQCQRVLILRQHSRLIRQKEWPVAPVPPVFNARYEPLAKLIFIGPRNLLQGLGSSAEQTSPIRQIFSASRQCHMRRPLIMRVSRS